MLVSECYRHQWAPSRVKNRLICCPRCPTRTPLWPPWVSTSKTLGGRRRRRPPPARSSDPPPTSPSHARRQTDLRPRAWRRSLSDHASAQIISLLSLSLSLLFLIIPSLRFLPSRVTNAIATETEILPLPSQNATTNPRQRLPQTAIFKRKGKLLGAKIAEDKMQLLIPVLQDHHHTPRRRTRV